jgi:CDP-glycerol glycerophosphotransferase (TagB/SpsB family)
MNVMIKPTHLILPTRVRDLEAFFGNPRRIAALSPRNWPLVEGFHKEKTPKAIELIVYAPTFSTEKDECIQVKIALRLASFASARGFEFQVKPHPNHGPAFSGSLLSQGLVPVDSQFDLQQLLADASVLVTDISSASIDLLLRNKPIVFTLWDEMEIVRDNSEVLRSRAIPGLVSSNSEDLDNVLSSAITEDRLRNQRLFAAKRYHGSKRTTPQSLVRRLRLEIRFYTFTSKFGKK